METVKVHVTSARNLRSSLLHAPSAVVELHTIPGFPAIAASEIIPSNANPVWDFTYEYEVNHYPPHRLTFVVIDSTRRKAAHLGRLSLEIIHPLTSGWFALSEDEGSSAELFLTIVCKKACEGRASFSHLVKYEAPRFEVGSSSQMELRQVADSPGFLFRSGELVVGVEAFGVPQSVRKPHLKLSLRDQLLKADETESSAAAWEKIKEEELVQQNEQIKTGQVHGVTNTSNADEQCETRHESRVEEGDEVNYNTTMKEEEESELSKPDEHDRKWRTWDGVAHSELETDVADTALIGRTKMLRVGSMSFNSMAHGRAPRKLLEARRAGLRRLRPFSRAISAAREQAEVHTVISRSSFDNGLETGAITRQNSAPGPCVNEGSLSGDPASKSKDDLSQNAASGNDPYETTSLLSALRSSIVGSSTTSGRLQPAQTLQTMMPFSRSVISRRSVDFGAVKFAVFAGEVPVDLRIQLVDRISKLPGSMNVFTDETIDLRGAQDLMCSCGGGCNGHILYYQANDRGPFNGKIILRVLIRMRTWEPRATTNNVTQRFLNILPRIDGMAPDFKESFPEAEKLTYLLIGGLFTDHYPTYFEKNIQYLQENLYLPRVQSVPIHTEGSVERNTKIIRDSVIKTCKGAKSVVLIGHSKGGVDATTVIQTYPDIIPFLYGIITFQAPFGGTFLVDFVAKSRLAITAIKSIIERLWKGDQESVQDLCYSSRLNVLGVVPENFSNAVENVDAQGALSRSRGNETENSVGADLDIFKRIPIVSFGSFASFALLGIRSAAMAAGVASMSPAAKAVLDHTGFLCDGLVTSNDARVPFSDFVSLDDMMHTEPALYVHGTNYPPGRLTASALVLLFEMGRRRKGRSMAKE